MKNFTWLLITAIILLTTAPLYSAPLFPDVPENHWARDAVADLAAKGILEGYPDGTFKGDRAVTRWEMAMAMQRFLAKMEAEHVKFATKADLEALRALVNNLKDELEALGVRVKNLEENVSSLDMRVTELERITFTGDFATRFVGMGLRNTGITGTFWNTDVGGIEGLNYIEGHKMGTIDLLNGRPLLNGTGFTARARLGMKIKVSKELKASLRLAAYTSLGDRYIDAYWGVPAPYLSNVFAGNSYFTAQPINNSIWTKMTLDNFQLEHVPSKTKLTVGSIQKTRMNDFILRNVPNPGIDGKKMLDQSRMGMIKPNDKYSSSSTSEMDMQGMPPGITPEMMERMKNDPRMMKQQGGQPHEGRDKPGDPRMMKMKGREREGNPEKMRAMGADPRMQGMPPGAGGPPPQQGPDMSYDSLPFYGIQVSGLIKKFSDFDWEVMYSKLPDSPFMLRPPPPFPPPPGVTEETVPYMLSATGGWKLKDKGAIRLNFLRISENFNNGQSTDTIPGRGNVWRWSDPYEYRNDNRNKMPMRGDGYISMQGQTSWGINIDYRFKPSNIKVNAAYAGTAYKPNQESGYTANGTHYHINVAWANKPDTLDLTLEYLYTDPYFDPFQLYYQPVGSMLQGGQVNATGFAPFPSPNYYLFGYQLHDSDKYTNNTHGFNLLGNYKFDRKKGIFHFHIGRRYQVECTTPQRDITDKYFGLKPGFIDPAFPVLASNNQTGAAARVYETPRGRIDNFGGVVSYFFAPTPLRASLAFDAIQVVRDTDYAYNTDVAKNNKVSMKYAAIRLGMEYGLTRNFTLKGGYNWMGQKGYNMGMNDFNATAGTDVINMEQTSPYLGFDYRLNKNTNWAAEIRYYDTIDKISNSQRRLSPESFQAIQVMSTFNVKF